MNDRAGELPINTCLETLLSAVEDGTPVVLKAPPGAGKQPESHLQS